LDWAAILASEGKRNDIVHSTALAEKYKLSLSSVKTALARQEDRGLVEHISKGIYLNKIARELNPRDLINVLRPDSYLSLESALSDFGVYSQRPLALTCISIDEKWTVKTPSVHITYRKIKKPLCWGYSDKRTRHGSYKVGDAEKAFLDWAYFRLRDGLALELDEFELGQLSRSRIVDYGKKFPSTVLKTLYPLLLEKSFAE
jgi:predicted transcriptional regulator of viral defense system